MLIIVGKPDSRERAVKEDLYGRKSRWKKQEILVLWHTSMPQTTTMERILFYTDGTSYWRGMMVRDDGLMVQEQDRGYHHLRCYYMSLERSSY